MKVLLLVLLVGVGLQEPTPQRSAEFDDGTIPKDWLLGTTSGATVVDGWVHLDNAKIGPNSTYAVSQGRTLTFEATLENVATQSAGYLLSSLTGYKQPWASFVSKGDGQLYARSQASNQQTATETAIPGSWLGSAHRYRIDWHATKVEYYIDDVLVQTHTVTISGTQLMRPTLMDIGADGVVLKANYMRLYNQILPAP